MSFPEEVRNAHRFAVDADISFPSSTGFNRTKVLDLSVSGIGLLVEHWIEPGELLFSILANKESGYRKTVLIRVVHTTAVDVGFRVGCSFVNHLQQSEISSLIVG